VRQEILSQLDVEARLTSVAELAAGEITVLELDQPNPKRNTQRTR
jgi:hypothetical protein